MENRIFGRIPIKVQVTISADFTAYKGVVTDISESGMFINAPLSPNLETPLEIAFILPTMENIVKIPVKVRRKTKTNGFYESYKESVGIGVEVIDPSPNYINFVKDLKAYYYPIPDLENKEEIGVKSFQPVEKLS